MKSDVFKTHYRTIIIVCCFLALFVNQGLASTSFNVYQTYITQIPEVGNAGGSLVVTIRTFVSLIAMFFVGFYYKKLSVRTGLFIACLLTALGFAVYGLVDFQIADSLLILCMGAVLTGAGYGLGGIVASTTLIGNWFRGHVGGAAGIVGMGSGVAAVIIPVAAADVIEFAGLSVSFFSESALALALAIIIVTLVRSKPSDIGAQPYQTKDHFRNLHKSNVERFTGDLTRSNKAFMILAAFFLGAATIVGNTYLTVLMTSSGINLIAAAIITSVCGAVLTISKILNGWTFDIIGTRAGSAIFFGFLILGLLLCFGVGSGSATDAFFASVFFGAGSALATTGLAVWALELSSEKMHLSLLRNLSVSFAFGGFLFNMMPGLLVGIFGTYEISYLILAIMATISGALVFVVYGRSFKKPAKQTSEESASAALGAD